LINFFPYWLVWLLMCLPIFAGFSIIVDIFCNLLIYVLHNLWNKVWSEVHSITGLSWYYLRMKGVFQNNMILLENSTHDSSTWTILLPSNTSIVNYFTWNYITSIFLHFKLLEDTTLQNHFTSLFGMGGGGAKTPGLHFFVYLLQRGINKW